MKRLATILLTLFLLLVSSMSARSFNAPFAFWRGDRGEAKQGRESIALVLGGGGAKGAAHVGALKVIEEAGIHPDIIVGTSIGAIVGGLYSIGYSAAQLDSLFLSQQWLQLFTREAINGNAIQQMLDTLCITAPCVSTPFPSQEGQGMSQFSCIAADLRSLTEVVLSGDSMARNMRASMSIPALFKPVRYDNYVLYDGGLINNLPVDVARQMGADIVIAVDLTVNHHDDKDAGEAFDINDILGDIIDLKSIKGLVGWLINRPDFKKYRENCKNVDIYINPQLEGYSATNFTRPDISSMIIIGERAARQQFDALSSLAKESLTSQ